MNVYLRFITTLIYYTRLLLLSFQLVLPFYQSSESTRETDIKTVITTPKVEQNVNLNNPSVVEIVDRVLGSNELKTLIAAVASESSTKGQLTMDDVSNLVK